MGFSLREFGTIQVMMMMIIGATYEMLILWQELLPFAQ
jgi:hypothetical protein